MTEDNTKFRPGNTVVAVAAGAVLAAGGITTWTAFAADGRDAEPGSPPPTPVAAADREAGRAKPHASAP
ncbi:hypothetical protein ROS62_14235 [Streptomyces sp. DSM 41972]|uniref:TlpA family protein disulfide reductase n=1 Tax=Streptomyces althioticus subsp. attaecolombicae TaxID=3075534 RepID=A0ABU3HZ35_9ACTN|nr:hypothetical protein [Streptomyces sp. DSM 41972]SCD93650.1 hypothetical protein GA0115238_136418 [Streptomyces sp. di50b]SCE16949.1 hypothetical protein GA0115245_124418 [Streptomyces sp. di188]